MIKPRHICSFKQEEQGFDHSESLVIQSFVLGFIQVLKSEIHVVLY